MFDRRHHKPFFTSYRPSLDLSKKGGKSLYTLEHRLRLPQNWDPLPDWDESYENKKVNQEEAFNVGTYPMMARRRGISPEDRFSREGKDVPDIGLTEEPARMGSEWRKDFYPEDYIEEGHGNLNKLLAFKSKEGRCQAKSKREDSHLIHLSYESMVRITARRLAKSGYPTQGRPNKPLYEEFKEKFFWRRNYKGPDQRAWFFYHVHEVLNNLKERTKMANWRPWLDPEIDLAKSSDEEEDFLQDPWVVEDDLTGSFNMAMPPGQRIIQEQEGATMPKQRDERQRRKR